MLNVRPVVQVRVANKLALPAQHILNYLSETKSGNQITASVMSLALKHVCKATVNFQCTQDSMI